MKKLINGAMIIIMLCAFNMTDIQASAPKHPEPAVSAKTMDAAQFQSLANRVQEIQAMDFSKLTMQEKKAVKKELRTIKSELKVVTGVYISAAALIIIIILLLLLL